jgi:hypothetical protein
VPPVRALIVVLTLEGVPAGGPDEDCVPPVRALIVVLTLTCLSLMSITSG